MHLYIVIWLLQQYLSHYILLSTGFPGGSDGKASACNVGDPSSIPGSGRVPWRRKWQPTPVLLPGKFYGLRSLVGYSPWDHRVGHDWATSLVHWFFSLYCPPLVFHLVFGFPTMSIRWRINSLSPPSRTQRTETSKTYSTLLLLFLFCFSSSP